MQRDSAFTVIRFDTNKMSFRCPFWKEIVEPFRMWGTTMNHRVAITMSRTLLRQIQQSQMINALNLTGRKKTTQGEPRITVRHFSSSTFRRFMSLLSHCWACWHGSGALICQSHWDVGNERTIFCIVGFGLSNKIRVPKILRKLQTRNQKYFGFSVLVTHHHPESRPNRLEVSCTFINYTNRRRTTRSSMVQESGKESL